MNKKHVVLDGETEMIEYRAAIATTWLNRCMYAEDIKDDDASQAWFRYLPVVETICTHIAYAVDTTPTIVFLAGVLYDNDYRGTCITDRLAEVRKNAMSSDNACLREAVSNGEGRMRLYRGRRRHFRLKKDDIESMSKEARSANLSLTDLGLLRFHCWYSDMSGRDTELVNINNFKEYRRNKLILDDAFEDLNDYLIDLEKRV